MGSANIDAKYYEKGAVRPGTFDSIVHFYKDKAFPRVSMQCTAQGMGAIVGKSRAECIDQIDRSVCRSYY